MSRHITNVICYAKAWKFFMTKKKLHLLKDDEILNLVTLKKSNGVNYLT